MNENIKIVINCYEANIGNMTSSVFAAVECLLNKGVQTEIITDAIHKAVAAKKPSWGYIWEQSQINIAQVKTGVYYGTAVYYG